MNEWLGFFMILVIIIKIVITFYFHYRIKNLERNLQNLRELIWEIQSVTFPASPSVSPSPEPPSKSIGISPTIAVDFEDE